MTQIFFQLFLKVVTNKLKNIIIVSSSSLGSQDSGQAGEALFWKKKKIKQILILKWQKIFAEIIRQYFLTNFRTKNMNVERMATQKIFTTYWNEALPHPRKICPYFWFLWWFSLKRKRPVLLSLIFSLTCTILEVSNT